VDYRMYKLSRLGSLLSARMFLSHFLPYILIAVLYGAYAYVNALAGYSVFYFLLVVIFVIHTAVRLSHRPADFTVEDRKIIFVDYLEKHVVKRHSKQGKPLFNKKAVIIRVRDIQKIKYSSNLIERIFNLGHIRLDGKVFLRNTDDTACHDAHAPDVIEIAGIKNFRTVCRELETVFPSAEHTSIKY